MKKFLIKKWSILINEFKSIPPKRLIKNILLMILGSLLLAIGTEMFLIPMKVIAGGSSSIALILSSFFPQISVEVFIIITYWLCFLIGLFSLGIRYSLKTLIVTATSPLFIFLIEFIMKNIQVDNQYIFDLTYWSDKGFVLIEGSKLNKDASSVICYILAVIVGPIIEGVGIALTMAVGGSSGGTDVFTLLLNKYFKIKVGLGGFIVDLTIMITGFFTINNFNLPNTLLGITASFILFLTIDKVFYAFNSTYVALISSEKYKEINDFIINKVGRGSTLIKSKGGYSKKDTYLIETCFDRNEYYDIQKEILKIDNNAFIRVMKSQEILGFGFTKSENEINSNIEKKENIEEESK